MLSAMIVSAVLVSQCGPNGCMAQPPGNYFSQSYSYQSRSYATAPAASPQTSYNYSYGYRAPYSESCVPHSKGRFKRVFKGRFRSCCR